MKITKSQLRKMIKEELDEAVVMTGEDYELAQELAKDLTEVHGEEKAFQILGIATRSFKGR